MPKRIVSLILILLLFPMLVLEAQESTTQDSLLSVQAARGLLLRSMYFLVGVNTT